MRDKAVIAIIGSGAVGLYYGGRLAQHGQNVHFLARSDYDAIKRSGFSVKSQAGDFAISPEAVYVYNDPAKMPKADLVILALKSASKETYRPLIEPLLKDDTAILALQNGLGNDEKLAELFGAQHIIGGAAFVCINRIGPGAIHHIAQGKIRIAELTGEITDRVKKLSEIFVNSRVPCHIADNLLWMRWNKLVWNIPFNGLGAALDMTTDRLLSSDEGMSLVTSLMDEVIAAARALGIEFPPETIQEQIDYTRTMGQYKTSMQIDRQEGRPMEIEALLGEPLRLARSAGVITPCLEMLYRIVSLGKLDNIAIQR